MVALHAEGLLVGDRAELAQQMPGGEAFEQAPMLDAATSAAVDVCCGSINLFATPVAAQAWSAAHPKALETGVRGRATASPKVELGCYPIFTKIASQVHRSRDTQVRSGFTCVLDCTAALAW
ncbi:hypothetical protein ACIHFD_19560 [Nonomuraea sp. NPDC051941]|uniref:hypothetical protein n=1 Tax=Nonomuraea sp. NPDC051941 TaxID=3364373 RepID=UPI0037C9F1F6